MISFGGWGGCETCSEIFSSETNRKEFVKSTNEILLKYDYRLPVISNQKTNDYLKKSQEQIHTAPSLPPVSVPSRKDEMSKTLDLFDSNAK